MFRGFNFVDDKINRFNDDGDDVLEVINPSTEEVYGTIPRSTKEEVTEAIGVARKAFPAWRSLSRVHRAEYFDHLAQLMKREQKVLTEAISLETGKNLNESHAEVIEALHMCQYAAASGKSPTGYTIASELDTKDAYVVRKPRGVVAVISPWNFPLAIGSFWSSAPALVEGNTVVHKPSELTPKVNQIVAQLYHEAGFPPGVYNLIHGDGTTGAALVRGDVDTILFTGSAEVGRDIQNVCSNSWNKTCSVECGSKSATIVFDDGDQDLALQASVASAFKLSGQRCVSSSRILIQRNIFDQFMARFVESVNGIIVTDPFKAPTDCTLSYGPLISQEQMNKVQKMNQIVRRDPDTKVLVDADGESGTLKDRIGMKGYFLRPFVYTCEWANKVFLKNEVFGPHVALIPFNDLDDAIRIYNDTQYGLALGVITDDFRKHRRLVAECNTGMLYINGASIGAESHLPFGGVGKSGNGHKSAAGTYKVVTDEIAVTINYEEGKMKFAQGMK